VAEASAKKKDKSKDETTEAAAAVPSSPKSKARSPSPPKAEAKSKSSKARSPSPERSAETRPKGSSSKASAPRTLAAFPRSKLHKSHAVGSGPDASVVIEEVPWVKDYDGVETWNEAQLYVVPPVEWRPAGREPPREAERARELPAHMEDGYDSIWLAAKRGDLDAVRRFHEDGEPLDAIDERDADPEFDRTWIGNLLIAASRSTTGRSPLYWAALMQQHDVVTFLVQNGAKDTEGHIFGNREDVGGIVPAMLDLLKELGLTPPEVEERELSPSEQARKQKAAKRRADMSRTHAAAAEAEAARAAEAAKQDKSPKKDDIKRKNSTFGGVVGALKKAGSKVKKALG
jgi:hypothetical protein